MTTDLSKIPSLDALTARQRAFVTNPMVLSDPELAAIQSGFSAEWSKLHAESLKKELHYYIVAGGPAQEARRNIDAKVILNEISNIAFSDVMDFFEIIDLIDDKGLANGSMMVPKQNIKALPPYLRRLIKRIRFDNIVLPTGTKLVVVSDIELHGKEWALKEMIEILRLRQSGTQKDETSELLEQMSANELEELEKVFTRVRTRVRKTIDKKRDADAIEADRE